MDKRERLNKAIAGEALDRAPVALWRHWPGDDLRSADLARSIIDFQSTYDWDFVNITPLETFSVLDYGLSDEWTGDLTGRRNISRRVIFRSLDWTDLRALDPSRGALGRQAEATRLIVDGLKDSNVPIIHTIYSPLMQAQLLAGPDLLVKHIRTQSDRVQTALNALTETTLRFIDALKRLNIDGVYYHVHHACYDRLTEEEYRSFGFPYDRKILDSLPERWWLKVLHVDGDAPMIKLCSGLPVPILHWNDQASEPDLVQGKLLCPQAVSGGLSRWQHLHSGSPTIVRDQVRNILAYTAHRRIIVAPTESSLISTPLSNIRALRQAVEG
jgi:uroporphyrinogen decarboxylase